MTRKKLLALLILLVSTLTGISAQGDLQTGDTYFIRNIATNRYLTSSPDGGLSVSDIAVGVTFENNDGWTIIKSAANTDWQMNYNDMALSDGQEGYNCWTLSKRGEHLYTISCRVKETYASLYVCDSDDGVYLLSEQPGLFEGLWEITTEPTSIESIEKSKKTDDETDVKFSKKGVYSVNGQKVSNESTEGLPKGIYIVNGNKIIIK